MLCFITPISSPSEYILTIILSPLLVRDLWFSQIWGTCPSWQVTRWLPVSCSSQWHPDKPQHNPLPGHSGPLPQSNTRDYRPESYQRACKKKQKKNNPISTKMYRIVLMMKDKVELSWSIQQPGSYQCVCRKIQI